MHTSKVNHVKTVEEFYKSIREQQEVAHGKEYCDQHDAIIKYMKECQNYVDYSDHMAPVSLKMNPEQRRINYEHNRRIILGDLGCAFRLEHYLGIHESVQQQLAL